MPSRGLVCLLLCGAAVPVVATAPFEALLPETAPSSVRVVLPKPAVTWMASPNHDARSNPRGITAIVIHDTETPGVRDARIIAHHFGNPRSEASAHFIIGKGGEIVQCVAEDRRAWHAGPSLFAGQPKVNDYAIGIELVNAEDGKDPFTEPQYRSLSALCAHLVSRYDVPMPRIVGHRDVTVPAGIKHDPADNFDWLRFRRDLRLALAQSGAAAPDP